MYQRFAQAIELLDGWGGLPSPREAKEIWDELWHLEAHHSTALEGNTLVLREVRQLLDDKKAVGAKDLGDYMEVLGYGEASRWVYGQALEPEGWATDDLISMTEVRRIHQTLMEKVWSVRPHPDAGPQEGPGAFRLHEIRAFAGGMQPPAHIQISADLSSWVDRANALKAMAQDEQRSLSDVPEYLAELHRDFEQIHPFVDGNGRTGRLVLNLILVRLGWPPVIILRKNREKYLKALEKADSGDVGPLAEQLCRSVIDNLHHLIPEIAGPARFVPLQALADDDLSYNALRQAAVRERLEATRTPDGSWHSSKRAVERYKSERHKRR